jgi:hypothetical protein
VTIAIAAVLEGVAASQLTTEEGAQLTEILERHGKHEGLAGSREKTSATVAPPLCSILPSAGTVAGCHRSW